MNAEDRVALHLGRIQLINTAIEAAKSAVQSSAGIFYHNPWSYYGDAATTSKHGIPLFEQVVAAMRELRELYGRLAEETRDLEAARVALEESKAARAEYAEQAATEED